MTLLDYGHGQSATVYPRSGGRAWGSLYDVDFTAQPSLTMPVAGDYYIDGKRWWAKGASPSGGSSVVNGAGLRINFGVHDPNALRTDRVLYMPLLQLAGFNPDAPTTLQFRFGGANFANWTAYAGFGELPENGGDMPIAKKQVMIGIGANATGHFAGIELQRTTSSYNTVPPWTLPPTNVVLSLRQVSDLQFQPGYVASSPSWPDPMTVDSNAYIPPFRLPSKCTAPGVIFFLNSLSGDFFLRNLRVMQPGA